MRVEIPFGDDGAVIDAGPENPKWIQAVKHDLHATHEGTAGPVREVLYLHHAPHLITAPTTVRRDNGLPSQVRVTDRQTDSDARPYIESKETA